MSASHEEALRAADDENYDMKWDAACAWGFPCFAKEGAPSETTLPAAPSLPDPVLGAPRHPLPAWPSTLATGTSAEEEAERAAADHKWGAAAKNKYHLGAADDSVSRGLVTEAHFWRTLGASTKDVGAAPLGDTEAARNYIDKRCHVDGAMFIARGAMTATEALGAAAGVRLLGAASPRETLSSASVPPDADAVVSEAASLGPLEILVDVKARKAMKRGNAQPQAAYLCMELGQKAWLHSGRAFRALPAARAAPSHRSTRSRRASSRDVYALLTCNAFKCDEKRDDGVALKAAVK